MTYEERRTPKRAKKKTRGITCSNRGREKRRRSDEASLVRQSRLLVQCLTLCRLFKYPHAFINATLNWNDRDSL
jgi:hypothetical protein